MTVIHIDLDRARHGVQENNDAGGTLSTPADPRPCCDVCLRPHWRPRALKRGYDFVGLFALTFVTGVGGGLIRDGLFLHKGRRRSSRLALLAGSAPGQCGRMGFSASAFNRIGRVILVIDALRLGAYGVVGVEKSLARG